MVSEMAAKRFTVELERVQRAATMFRVPFDLEEAFGRARPPVRSRSAAIPGGRRPACTAESATSS